VDGVEVSDPRVFNYRLATKGVGNVAKLTVNRAGKLIDVSVTLTKAPETTPREQLTIEARSPFQGATVANVSPAIAAEIGLSYRGQTGVVVTAVAAGAPADRIGLQKGDIILSVNGNDITATKVLAAVADSDPMFWRLAIDRNGQILRMAFR